MNQKILAICRKKLVQILDKCYSSDGVFYQKTGFLLAEYGVKALSAYCGVNAHTLRIWERRYGAVTPARSANGRRVYSQEDAERLCLIAELTAKGFAISRVATLALLELEALLSTLVKAPMRPQATPASEYETKVNAMLLDRMVHALEQFRLRELSAQLAVARVHCSVADFVYQIILPLIGRIGILVNEEKLWIAHEHALSAIVKTHIYQSIYSLSSTRDALVERPGPSLCIATQEGDYHEFGILLSALLLQSRGVSTHFFGCNMPAKSLADAANAIGSSVVLIGRSIKMPVILSNGATLMQKTYLKELDQLLSAKTEIWLGGVLEQNALKFRARRRVLHIGSLPELERKVEEVFGVPPLAVR